jgi:hypothetical protein
MRTAALSVVLCALLFGLVGEARAMEQRDKSRRRLDTIGLYIQPPGEKDQHFYDFFKASGYNYLEFVEGGFAVRPDRLPKYYSEMSHAIDAAHSKGFKVWILLLAGMNQWKGPADGGSAGTFGALDKSRLAERLTFLKQAVEGMRNADGFVFFAGDPGGDPEGRATVEDCIAFSKQVQELVRTSAPRAGFTVNLWAIAEWAGFPSPFSLTFWRKQVDLSRAVAEAPGFLGPDCGIVFSLDNYYRSLTLAAFADAEVKPEPYPAISDIKKLRAKQVKPVLGWPYFLVDEVDDGFITPNNVVTGGQSQGETRYIRAIVDRGMELGLDGLVANASYIRAEPLNIYVFGQMCRNPGLTPGAALDKYAGFIADAATKGDLAKVLRFIENHSNWQNSLPPASRLKDFDCEDVTTAAIALERLANVAPNKKPAITLPEAPAPYLERLRKRLEAIAAGQIGGVAPIVKSKPTQEKQ